MLLQPYVWQSAYLPSQMDQVAHALHWQPRDAFAIEKWLKKIEVLRWHYSDLEGRHFSNYFYQVKDFEVNHVSRRLYLQAFHACCSCH